VIPAVLALPVAEGLAGSVLSSVGGTLAGLFNSGSTSAAGSISSFAPMLRQAASQAHAAALNSPMGTMTANDIGGLGDSDLRTWMMGLTGKTVHAVDSQGHAVSGVVEGYSQTGGTMGLNINGHLVSVAGLTQISWSPSTQSH
jgi:hypothetical protein